jgi:triphosphatase
MDSDTLEVEWQYAALDTRPVLRWLEATGVPGFEVAPTGQKQLDDTYCDTADWRVNHSGYTCRVRRKGSEAELTLKAMAAASGGMRIRRELTESLEANSLDPLRAPGACGAALRAVCGRQDLAPIFQVLTNRKTFRLSDEDGEIGEIALDETSIPVGEDVPVRLSRVEVEVARDAIDRARTFVDAMVAANGLNEATTSKFESALIATGQRVSGASDVGPTSVSPEMTAGQVAFAVLRKQFGVFRVNEPGTRLGDDIEALHDMRVATRRLRAAMAAFRPFLSQRMLSFRDEFGWIAAALGEVRDLDVQLERMVEWREAFPDERAHALDAIEEILVARRNAARKRMLAALDSRRYERLLTRFEAALRFGPPRTFVPGRTPILAVAPDLVEKRYRTVRKAGDRIKKNSPPDSYHLLRIDAKKLRYALEFVGNGIYGKPALEFSARVTALQDNLGLHQDAYVAMDLLQEVADTSGRKLGPSTLMAMGILSERYRSHAEELRAQFPDVYKPLAGDDWKRLMKLMESRRPVVEPSNTARFSPAAAARESRQGAEA